MSGPPLPRRVFLERLAIVAGGATAAAALLPILENDPACAEAIEPDDKRITGVPVTYPGSKSHVRAYLVRPRKGGAAPVVIVVHENHGLDYYIANVARRLAVEGYVALAPDLLTVAGGTPLDPDAARERIAGLDPATALADLRAGVAYMAKRSGTTGKVGAVGFAWGGGLVNELAVAEPTLKAAVVFYGMAPALAGVRSIKAPLLLHCAELDERVNATEPAYEAALKSAGKNYTVHRYPGVASDFHNDTNEARYHEQPATLAWQRTLDFFKQNLA